LPAFRDGFRSHFADFWIDSSFGLNWNSMLPRSEASFAPPAEAGLASYTFSVAGALDPPADAPPLAPVSAIAFDATVRLRSAVAEPVVSDLHGLGRDLG
jgi:hypothetical protein